MRKAAARFASLGAVVDEVSIPLHGDASSAIFLAVTRPDMADVFVHGRPPDLLSWPLAHLDAPAPDAGGYARMNAGAPTVMNKLLSGTYIG